MNEASSDRHDGHIALDRLPYINNLITQSDAEFKRVIGLDVGEAKTADSYDYSAPVRGTMNTSTNDMGSRRASHGTHQSHGMHQYAYINSQEPFTNPGGAYYRETGAEPSNRDSGFTGPYFTGGYMSPYFPQNSNESGPSTLGTFTLPQNVASYNGHVNGAAFSDVDRPQYYIPSRSPTTTDNPNTSGPSN